MFTNSKTFSYVGLREKILIKTRSPDRDNNPRAHLFKGNNDPSTHLSSAFQFIEWGVDKRVLHRALCSSLWIHSVRVGRNFNGGAVFISHQRAATAAAAVAAAAAAVAAHRSREVWNARNETEFRVKRKEEIPVDVKKSRSIFRRKKITWTETSWCSRIIVVLKMFLL